MIACFLPLNEQYTIPFMLQTLPKPNTFLTSSTIFSLFLVNDSVIDSLGPFNVFRFFLCEYIIFLIDLRTNLIIIGFLLVFEGRG